MVAVVLAFNVNVLVLVVLEGLRNAVTPPGRRDADKATAPRKPFFGATVIVLFPLALRVMVTLLGKAEREKSGAAFTVRLSAVV